MEPPVDVDKLSLAARKILDPASPTPMRQMAAKGVAPGLKPGDALAVVAILSESADTAIASAAKATLDKLPAPVLNGALPSDLPAAAPPPITPGDAPNSTPT